MWERADLDLRPQRPAGHALSQILITLQDTTAALRKPEREEFLAQITLTASVRPAVPYLIQQKMQFV